MARRKNKNEDDAPQTPSIFDTNPELLTARRRITTADGYSHDVLTDDECCDVLRRVIADEKWTCAEYNSVLARFECEPDSVAPEVYELLADAVIALLDPNGAGIDLSPLQTDDAPTPEMRAAEKLASIESVLQIIAPLKRKTLMAKELFRRGYHLEQIREATGWSRTTLNDAREIVRYEHIKEGKALAGNLHIDRRRGRASRGIDKRDGSGPLFEEKREASRAMALVANDLKVTKKWARTRLDEDDDDET